MVWLVTGDRADRVDVRAAVHRAGMPDGLASALLTSLAIDPSDRHADVGHWLADVTEAIAPTLPERMLRAAMRRGSRTARPRRRRRSVVGAIALIVIGALAGVAGAAWLGDSGDAQRVEDVGGGRVRVVDTAGAATRSLVPPRCPLAG